MENNYLTLLNNCVALHNNARYSWHLQGQLAAHSLLILNDVSITHRLNVFFRNISLNAGLQESISKCWSSGIYL